MRGRLSSLGIDLWRLFSCVCPTGEVNCFWFIVLKKFGAGQACLIQCTKRKVQSDYDLARQDRVSKATVATVELLNRFC